MRDDAMHDDPERSLGEPDFATLRQRAFNLRWATAGEGVIPLTAADPDFYECSPERTALIAKLTSAHNAFLDEAAARGVVGVSLLAALVATCAWWAWKADPSTATLGMLAAWFGLSLTTPASLRTVPMMLLALIVARTSMLASCRRPLG